MFEGCARRYKAEDPVETPTSVEVRVEVGPGGRVQG